MQMSIGLGIPLQVPVSNKTNQGISPNSAMHLNPGVRTNPPSQKMSAVLPNNSANSLPTYPHPLATNRQPVNQNQPTFAQPHFVNQANVVGQISNSALNTPHQFPVQNPQIFIPVHPPQKKGT